MTETIHNEMSMLALFTVLDAIGLDPLEPISGEEISLRSGVIANVVAEGDPGQSSREAVWEYLIKVDRALRFLVSAGWIRCEPERVEFIDELRSVSLTSFGISNADERIYRGQSGERLNLSHLIRLDLFGANSRKSVSRGSEKGDKIKAFVDSQLLPALAQIFADEFPSPLAIAETPAERGERLLSWFEEELTRGEWGAGQRVADREGVSRQTASDLLKRARERRQ